MAKINLNNIEAGYLSNTAYNANNDLIEAAFENTLSRDGTTPNQMEANIDMNGHLILNQGNPIAISGMTWEGPWLTLQSYSVGDIVENGGTAYICVTAHTSGVFADDLAAAKWQLFASASLPSQVGNAGKFLQTDGATVAWEVPDSSEVSYTAAGAGAVATTVQTVLRESINVKRFGATGDGVTDDSAAINTAISAIAEGGTLFFPRGTYVCLSPLVNSNKALVLKGESSTGAILQFTGCNGLVLTHDGNNLKTIEVRELSITTTNNGLYTGVSFTAVSASAYKVPRFRMEKVNLSGSSVAGASTEEWLVGLSVTEGDSTYLADVSIKGKETAYVSGYLPATKGIVFTNSTTVHANGVQIYRVKTGIELTGQSEGFVLQQSEIVAVHTGINGVSLVAPSNNHQINNVHISASQTGIKIDQTTTPSKTLGHSFSNMFVLKRTGDIGMPVGGDPGYKAFDVSIDRSTFSNISLHTNDATTDRYADGDRGIVLRDAATNNMLTNIVGFLCATCVTCLDTARDNFINQAVLVNTSAFIYPPVTSVVAEGQITSAVIDTTAAAPVPSTGSEWRQIGSQFDFHTRGGRAFRITNGALTTDSFVDVFGQALADACCSIRANSESGAADVDLRLLNRGAGKIRFGTHTVLGAEVVTGYIEIKDAGGTVRKIAVVS